MANTNNFTLLTIFALIHSFSLGSFAHNQWKQAAERGDVLKLSRLLAADINRDKRGEE